MVSEGNLTKTIKSTIISLIEERTKLLGFYFRESEEIYSLYSIGTLVASKSLNSQDAVHNSNSLDGILTYLSGYEQCVKDNNVKLNENTDDLTEVIFQDDDFKPDFEEDKKLESTWEKKEEEKDVKDISQDLLRNAIGEKKLKAINEENAERVKEVKSMRDKSIKDTEAQKAK